MRDTITIFGNYGELTVDAKSGRVLAYEASGDEPEFYRDIVKVDLAEHYQFWGESHRTRFKMIDVLDVGLWSRDERGQLTYDEAESDWREEILRNNFVHCKPDDLRVLEAICL